MLAVGCARTLNLPGARGSRAQRAWMSPKARPHAVARVATPSGKSNADEKSTSEAVSEADGVAAKKRKDPPATPPTMQTTEEKPAKDASPAPVTTAASTTKEAPAPATPAPPAPRKKRVVVVGAGWGGFGAAKHLSEQGYEVKLVDASPNPGGLSSGWRTKEGKTVEAGMKGFWYQYKNIFRLVDELGIDKPFTAFTRSGFWAPDGLVTESPVFSNLPRLPTMLGQFVYTFDLFKRLPLADRMTMVPLFAAVVDYNATPATYARYDRMTARELFRQFGVSQRLYDSFLKPLLLVGLFAPPEELSAAVVLDTFYFYALAHQADFDVCWCKGSVAERIFQPLINRMKASGTEVLGGHTVVDLAVDNSGRATSVMCQKPSGDRVTLEADAVVLAVGVTGMQKLVSSVPALARRKFFRGVCNLRGIDVIATRLWVDKRVQTEFASNVLSGFVPGVGGTWFHLNDLQDEYHDAPGSVIAADFYNASSLMPLPDDKVVQRVMESLRACEPGFQGATCTDYAVLRFPRAVTHFTPGSYEHRLTQTTPYENVFVAGDWVRDVPHGAHGLSQERAYVTGLRAANLVVEELGVGRAAEILDVEEDEPHVKVPRELNRAVKAQLETLGVLPSPLLF